MNVCFAVLWFGVNLIHPVGPGFLLWLPTALGGILVTWAELQTSGSPELTRAARQLWRRLAATTGFATIGLISQAYDVLQNPDVPGSHVTPVLTVCAVIAQIIVVYALLRLPIGDGRPGEFLRLVIDASTVMLAAAVILWHFQTRHLGGLFAALALTATGMIVVFAVVKVILSTQRAVDRTALRILAIGIVVGTLIPSTQPYLSASHPGLFATMIGNPLCFFISSLAARRQLRAGTGTVQSAAPRRPFSLMPYAAVAAVQALVIMTAFKQGTSDDKVVVVVAALVIALVVARQLIALVENGRLVRRLDHSATHDPLTGLANRVVVQRRLDDLHDDQVAVVLIDLDGFKQVNDTRGHAAGDELLVVVAERLADCVRDSDVVARLGGDEFIVLLPDADAATAEAVVRRMVIALAEPVRVGEQSVQVEASIGIATGHPDTEHLQRCADIAMYAAKDLPGSAFVHYSEGQNVRTSTLA